jgi:hypothetical protein
MIYLTSRAPQAVLGGGACGRRYGCVPDYRGSGSTTAASGSEEAELAWSLAEVASRCLDAVERNNVFVAIGTGETFTAIGLLLGAITREGSRVETRLSARLSTWLGAYAGHDDEPRLRRLISRASYGFWDEPTAVVQQRVGPC